MRWWVIEKQFVKYPSYLSFRTSETHFAVALSSKNPTVDCVNGVVTFGNT